MGSTATQERPSASTKDAAWLLTPLIQCFGADQNSTEARYALDGILAILIQERNPEHYPFPAELRRANQLQLYRLPSSEIAYRPTNLIATRLCAGDGEERCRSPILRASAW
jgi:hypothetical protein